MRILVLLLLVLQIANFTTSMDAKALSAAITRFSSRFCNELEKDKSIVSSPLSAEIVLALLTLGTTDLAHTELLTSLGISDDDAIRSSFSLVASKLRSVKGVTLNVANKVYIKEGEYDLRSELKEDAVKIFDADFEKVNFDDGVAAAQLINNWVESKTNNRIKDLLSSDSLNADTRLVLINALYFKGTWKKQFNPNNTIDQPFHVNNSITVKVPRMYKEDNYKYGESQELQAQLLEMAYEDDEASMLIVLPNEVEGLNKILKKLADGYDLMAEVDKMFSTKVQVSVPKFKIETTIDLAKVLPKLGIKAIFDSKHSGLTRILNNDEMLYVSEAVQKAFIEVNEEGAEAAAATGMVMMLRCARPPPPRFHADRPFLYMLVNSEGIMLFVGVYRGTA